MSKVKYSVFDEYSHIQYHFTEHAYWCLHDTYRYVNFEDKISLEDFILLMCRLGDCSERPFIRRDLNSNYHKQLIGCTHGEWDTQDIKLLGWEVDPDDERHWHSIRNPQVTSDGTII